MAGVNLFGELLRAQLENLGADPSAGLAGRMFWNTASGQAKVDDGTNVRALLRNDQNIVVGNNGTAANNVRVNRAGSAFLQFLIGSDTTAEGTAQTTLSNWANIQAKLGGSVFDTQAIIAEIASPTAPAAGYHALYFKADGNLYSKNSANTETKYLTAGNTYTAPTVQKFLSGSGTYTTPAGVLYIEVEMVGGGGGGGGTGTASQTSGGNGGNTTFGTSLLVADGGTGGSPNGTVGLGGAGGTASLGTGPIGIAVSGSYGQGASQAGGVYQTGGAGGSSAFGGGGGSGEGVAGSAGATNSGSGGGGAGTTGTPNGGASGGGSGGYVKAIITSPASSYSYAVGSSGTAGTAGTSGFAGGAGGSGVIIVREYYQ